MARTDTIDKRAKKAKTSASASQRKGKFAAATFRMKKEAAAFWQKFNGEAMKFSLSFRLMIFFALVSGVVWGIAGYISYKETRESIDEFFDTYQMALGRQLAAADWSGVSLKTQKATDKLIKGIENADEDDDAVGFAIFSPQGEMIFHDNENGKYFTAAEAAGSFANERIGEDRDKWRMVRLKSADGKFIIAVGQELEYREDLAMDILEEFMLPWLAGFIVLLLAISGLTFIEFRPLKKLASEIESRPADDFSPLNAEKAPTEIKPLLKAMNRMFAKIEALLARERSFISDSAHELRTPLTALKIQLEIAEMSGDDSQMRMQALAKLSLGIERAEHLVEQLLALSRLEADNGHYDNTELLDWKDISAALFDNYAEAAKKKNITLSSYIGATSPIVRGNHILAALLLRNLLDNAVKYSPNGAKITATVDNEEIAVVNSGTIVDEAVLARLSERFFRPAGQKETGSGLGLAIVKRIAGLYGCSLDFANTDDGFKAAVRKN